MKKILFWILSFTWGLPVTLIGLVCAVGLLISGHKPKLYHGYLYFEVGHAWGGFNGGPFIFVQNDAGPGTMWHEAGHGIQNIIFGPAMLFVVTLPSVIRYWYIQYLRKTEQWDKIPNYYDIWFEAQATKLGNKFIKQEV